MPVRGTIDRARLTLMDKNKKKLNVNIEFVPQKEYNKNMSGGELWNF